MGNGDLLAVVKETTARARDRANVEFSGIGANSLLDQHKNGVRNPPELMFDSLQFTDRIFKDLALPERVFLTSEDFVARFHQIKLDCHQPDSSEKDDDDFRQECYLKYLVLGALFASANRWIVAEQLAESAVRIIERAKTLNDPIRVKMTADGEPRSHISGREGYFLLASSKRVRAETDVHFKKAQKILSTARECLREDRNNGSGLRVPFIRFDCEELAISLGRYYSAREKSFRAGLERGSDDYDPCHELVDVIYDCMKALLAARERMRQADEQLDIARGDQLAFIPVGTRTSIATNLIQVYVISEFRKFRGYEDRDFSPISRSVVEEAIDVLSANSDLIPKLCADGFLQSDHAIDLKNGIICSPLMLLYSVVGALLLGVPRLAVLRSEDDVDKIFGHYEASVTPYDNWRYGELRKFAKWLVRERQN
jgi:hypothetical protein